MQNRICLFKDNDYEIKFDYSPRTSILTVEANNDQIPASWEENFTLSELQSSNGWSQLNSIENIMNFISSKTSQKHIRITFNRDYLSICFLVEFVPGLNSVFGEFKLSLLENNLEPKKLFEKLYEISKEFKSYKSSMDEKFNNLKEEFAELKKLVQNSKGKNEEFLKRKRKIDHSIKESNSYSDSESEETIIHPIKERKQINNENAPPIRPYQQYLREISKTKYADKPGLERKKLIANDWHKLVWAEKEKYFTKYNEDKKKYDEYKKNKN